MSVDEYYPVGDEPTETADLIQDGVKVGEVVTAAEPQPSKDALAKIEAGLALAIVDQPSLDVANDLLHCIKDYEIAVEKELGPGIQKAFEQHRYLVAQKKRWLDRAIAVRDILKKKVADFLQEQDRIRWDAQRKATLAKKQVEAETWKGVDRAHELIREGKLDEVDQVTTESAKKIEAIQAAAPVVPEKVVAEGSYLREDWDFEVVDAKLVPDEFKLIDEKKLRGVVKFMKDQTNIPGIRAFSKKTLVTRSGK